MFCYSDRANSNLKIDIFDIGCEKNSRRNAFRWFVPGRPAGQNGLFLPINDVSEERKHDFYTENRINGQNKTPFGTHFGTPNAGLVI